ncbi:MAG: hypothetical protein RIC95_10655 [Vicingaceae bacterium]
MPSKRNKLSFILIISAILLLILTAYGTIKRDWDENAITQVAVIGVSFLIIGLLLRQIDEIPKNSFQKKAEKERKAKIIEKLEQGVIATLSGIGTALIFASIYYTLDFGEPNEISEHYLDKVCPYESYTIENLTNENEIKSYPNFWDLFPGFIFLGAIVGMSIGFIFPQWRLWLKKSFSKFTWLYRGPIAYITFGIVWGFLLGGFFIPVFFGTEDGRPFMQIYTSALSTEISVLSYVCMAYIFYRNNFTEKSIYDLVVIVAFSIAIVGIIYMADWGFNLSEKLYCYLYQSWNTKTNDLQMNFSIWFASALYGSFIGLLVMIIVATYHKIQLAYSTSHSQK